MSKHDTSLQAITCRLDDIAEKPGFRGCLEGVDGEFIQGWCLSTAAPHLATEVDIFVGDCLVGTVTTSYPRDDISRLIGFPVRPGFRFSIRDCSHAALRTAVHLLSTASADALGRLIAVRAHGTGLDLPYGVSFVLSADDVGLFCRLMRRRLAMNDAAQRSVIGEQRGDATPAPDHNRQGDVSLIAFYVPHGHQGSRGKAAHGFGDWTDVAAAQPFFSGHDQPRIPTELGFYDLRIDDVQARQVSLARQYGIRGFCYRLRWSGGAAGGSVPIDRHVEKNYDLDFCICWDNLDPALQRDDSDMETRVPRSRSDVDEAGFIHSVIPYFKCGRSIRIDGAPLLVVLDVASLSNPSHVIGQWRSAVREAGFPDLHVCVAEMTNPIDPREFGADSSCQIPPHGTVAADRSGEMTFQAPGFKGRVYDYAEIVAAEIRWPDPPYLRFRGAMPGFDTSGCRGVPAQVWRNASPEQFEAWLVVLCAKARRSLPPDRRFVFVNAWNDWPQGAYLEPDRRHGHGYLTAVRNAVSAHQYVFGDAMLPAEADSDRFRAEALRTMATLANANRQLLRCLTLQDAASVVGSPFIRRPTDSPRSIVSRPDATLVIEGINGHADRPSAITVSRQGPISVAGWLRLPDIPITRNLPLFVRLLPSAAAPEAADYVAAISIREARPDVAALYPEDSSLCWHGFRLLGLLERVPDGTYRLGLLVGSPFDADAAYAIASDIVLHLG